MDSRSHCLVETSPRTSAGLTGALLRLAALFAALLVATPTALAQACGWTQVGIGQTGPVSGGAGFAHDTTRGETVVFGGFTASGNSADTWTWDGSNWTLRGTAGPPGRQQGAAAHDTARGVTVLYGGSPALRSYLSDVWEWNGTTWTSRGTGPSGRMGHAAAYDSRRGATVFFGGHSDYSNPLRETWEWDGNSWRLAATSGPSARTQHAMAYDSARGVVVVFGGWDGSSRLGDTWEWDGATWTQRGGGPSPRYRHAMTYDSARGVTILHGGSDSSGALQDAWEWDGAVWSQRASSGPPARMWHALAYDLARDKVVLAGGLGAGFLSDTWEWSDPVAPAITQQPVPQTVGLGQPLLLAVGATGPGLAYQWRRDGVALQSGGAVTGARGATLNIDPTSAADSGSYDVVVSNGCGAVTSAAVPVGVLPVGLTLGQRLGSGSLDIINTSALAGRGYFTAISLDPANATSPGTGIWFGLHITLHDLLGQFVIGTPPFGGVLDASGRSTFVVPPGTLSALNGLSMYSVTYTWDRSTLAFTGNSNIASVTFR